MKNNQPHVQKPHLPNKIDIIAKALEKTMPPGLARITAYKLLAGKQKESK